MNARLPAKCRGCGARVELSIGEKRVWNGWQAVTFTLPTQWCVPGTNEIHRCVS